LLLLAVTAGSWAPGAGSAVLFLLFVFRIRTAAAASSFVSPSLFRNRRNSAGLAIAVLVMGIGYSLPFLTP